MVSVTAFDSHLLSVSTGHTSEPCLTEQDMKCCL